VTEVPLIDTHIILQRTRESGEDQDMPFGTLYDLRETIETIDLG